MAIIEQDHKQHYFICIWYKNGLGTCKGRVINFNKPECTGCEIRLLSQQRIIKSIEIPEQRCYNFDIDNDICVQCRKKRAGKGKVCYKSDKLTVDERHKRKLNKNKQDFNAIRLKNIAREFDEMMRKRIDEVKQ